MKYLRICLSIYAGLWIAGGFFLFFYHATGFSLLFLSYFIFNGVIILVGILFEKKRYHPHTIQQEGWIPTKEKFVEPDGRKMTVYYHPKTGERKYVAGE